MAGLGFKLSFIYREDYQSIDMKKWSWQCWPIPIARYDQLAQHVKHSQHAKHAFARVKICLPEIESGIGLVLTEN